MKKNKNDIYKIRLSESIGLSLDSDDMEKITFSPNGMCSFLMDHIVKHGQTTGVNYIDKYESFRLEREPRYWDDDSSDSYEVIGIRLETDEEFEKREEDNRKRQAAAKKRSETMKKVNAEKAKLKKQKELEDKKKLYEKLKKEFET